MGKNITDPVEIIIANALEDVGHGYRHESEGGQRLDFFVHGPDIFIECKQFSTPRTSEQIDGMTNVVLVQGIDAAHGLAKLIRGKA